MKITNIIGKILFITIFLNLGACEPEPDPDPCLKTKWTHSKEYEIRLATKISSANPNLPGGTNGSLKPEEYQSMVIWGTIEKAECNDSTSGPVNLGNTYITRGVDNPALIYIPNAYWIGHVVYVYDFDNDKDHLKFDLTVRITMIDGQTYECNITDDIDSVNIELVPDELYYYVLLDVYSDLWVKVQ